MANLNEDRCPYCFSKFLDAQYSNDPILIPDGARVVYDEASGLLVSESDIEKRRYKGLSIIRNKHIKELQEINEDNKPLIGWTVVEGNPESFWIPNKIHIKELREAIEKGLGITETTTPIERTTIMEQFLNYDSEGTERQIPHQMDWTDPNLISSVWQGNISHMHLEDLRKYIIIDKLWFNYLSASQTPYIFNNIYELQIKGLEPNQYIEKTGIETSSGLSYQTFRWNTPRSTLTSDAFWSTGLLLTNDCIFKFGRASNNLFILQKYINFTTIETNPSRYWFTNYFMHLFSDNNYIYCCGTGNGNLGFVKLDKDCNIIKYQYYNVGYNPNYLESMITMDNQYFYLMTSQIVGIGQIDYTIRRYNKINFSYIDEYIIFHSNTSNYFWDNTPSFGWGYQMIVDENYIYILQSLFHITSSDSWLKLYRYNKTTFILIDTTTLLTRSDPMKNGFYINALGQSKEFLLINVPVAVGVGEWNKYIKKSNLSIINNIAIPTFDVYSPVIMNFASDWERKMRSV